jgi:hypothetical protein
MRALVLLVVLAGCAKVEAFECESDSQCVDGGSQGICEASKFCSFPDAGCPGGKRYGEYAGDGLAGSCVDGGSTSGSTGGATSGGECADGQACAVDCADVVFGLRNEAGRTSCLAYAAGSAMGTCEAGVCVPAEGACAGAGAEIAGCEVACARADHNCAAGGAAAAVTVATLCTTGATTSSCKPRCAAGMGSSLLTPYACDADGACVAGMVEDCDGYVCAEAGDACLTACKKQTECAQGFMCATSTNTCE